MHALRDEHGARVVKSAALPPATQRKRKKEKSSIEDLPAIGQDKFFYCTHRSETCASHALGCYGCKGNAH